MKTVARLVRAVGGCLLAGAMSVPLGPTTTSRAVDQMNASSMRGVPVPPVPAAPRRDMIWVPDQYIAIPQQPNGVHVPGHWEQITRDGHVIVPPLTVTVPGTGAVRTLPSDVTPSRNVMPTPDLPPVREAP
jgi:hypothetical protein